MALNDIVEQELDNWRWSMLAMDMVQTMWTAVATTWCACGATSVEAKSVKNNFSFRENVFPWTHRARLWQRRIIVNHSIASRHRNLNVSLSIARRHQQTLTNCADNLPLIFWILVAWSSHVVVTQCRRQWRRCVRGIHLNGFVFIIQVRVVKVLVIFAFWSVERKTQTYKIVNSSLKLAIWRKQNPWVAVLEISCNRTARPFNWIRFPCLMCHHSSLHSLLIHTRNLQLRVV